MGGSIFSVGQYSCYTGFMNILKTFRVSMASPRGVLARQMSFRILKSIGFGVSLGLVVAGFLSDLIVMKIIGILTLTGFIGGFFYYRKRLIEKSEADYRVFLKDFVSGQIVAPSVNSLLSDNEVRARSIAALRLLEDEKLRDIESFFTERVPGQQAAIAQISKALREKAKNIGKSTGPFFSFMFAGPVGVGKLEAAGAVSEYYFGSDEFLIKFDMAKFVRGDSAIRFFGSPDNPSDGVLARALSSKQRYVLLCDNFDMTHPDIKNMFLKILEDPDFLRKSKIPVSFTNAILIFSFNILSPQSIVSPNALPADFEKAIVSRTKALFSPEFVSAVSLCSIFHPLSQDGVTSAVSCNLSRLSRVLSETQGINVSFDSSAVTAAAKIGYDSAFGLRPLKDAVSAKIRNKIADGFVEGSIKKGSKLKVGYSDNDFVFYV